MSCFVACTPLWRPKGGPLNVPPASHFGPPRLRGMYKNCVLGGPTFPSTVPHIPKTSTSTPLKMMVYGDIRRAINWPIIRLTLTIAVSAFTFGYDRE